ncbi:MAG TPA: AMP-binding protein [Stackebrandtia sp.]|uniref:AMP-binding protein n=1 Tax=Stackebrandtia sp. TaxID=2023065 RepID=UPI002D3A97F8|nr:AMP-binding protein [Stackebrandtia sp.]HZE41713.1 AMP-binding protein [Stackebrandtia sp.]
MDAHSSPTMAARAWRAAGTGVHIGTTLARRGFLKPGHPVRMVRHLATLRHWGFGLPGGFAAAARRAPFAAAVIDDDGELTWSELDERADALAHALAEHGAEPRLAVLCRNHRGLVLAVAAAGKIGADLVLLNTGLSAQQLCASLRAHRASVVIADAEFLPLLDGVGVPVVSADADGETTLDDLVARGAGEPHRRPPRYGHTIMLTSGTTGNPKGARRPDPALHSLTAMLSRIPLRVGDRIHIPAPMFHAWGFAAMQLAVALRATMVLRRRFEPADLLATLDRRRCTAMFAVPVMLQRLLEVDAAERRRHDTAALRVVATAGSALPGDFAHRFMDAFGEVLYNLYGTTEVSWASIARPAELRRAYGTSGRPPHGTRIVLLDADGAEVPRGHTGRIFVGNEMLFDGYTDGSGRALRDGTMDTGDLGHLDAEGLLFVDGRGDDMIISGGENVYPLEVESLLDRMPGVREAAVIGVDDDAWGQRLVAYVVAEPGRCLGADDVRDHVRKRLARFSVPRDVHFIDELPRNAVGKIVPRLLTPPDRPVTGE